MKKRPDGLFIPEHNDDLGLALFMLAKDVEILADEMGKIRVALESKQNIAPNCALIRGNMRT